MLNLVEDPQSGVLELAIDGGLNRTDYMMVVDAIEHLLETHRRINLLEVVSDIGWIEPADWWLENTAHLAKRQFIDRVAVVSETGQVGPVARAFAVFFPSEIRVFRGSEAKQARIWLTGSSASPRRRHSQA